MILLKLRLATLRIFIVLTNNFELSSSRLYFMNITDKKRHVSRLKILHCCIKPV